MKVKAILATAILSLGGLNVQAFADTASTLNTEATRLNTLAASHGETNVTGKISGTFSSFLGPDSTAVVTGLRNGTPITLTTTTPAATPGAAPTVTTTVITPPTGTMGHGNVFISLALAKQQLGQLGISQPTPEQLQAALTGGTITTGTGTTATTTQLQGVLTMRSQGMGWGQIAQQQGTKLGPVISGLKSANKQMTTANASSTGSQSTSASSRIVSGSGKSHGQAVSGQNKSGEGIVSGSNRSTGNGNAYGKGIVTGSGQAAGGNSGITTAGGHGNSGQAKGHGK
ncbi:MAG TPA: hypothetical protein VLJ79_00110 [Candidatus Binatia bacterium]|nr:hypothetical protein [Candidatus Binatia bacterium]